MRSFCIVVRILCFDFFLLFNPVSSPFLSLLLVSRKSKYDTSKCRPTYCTQEYTILNAFCNEICSFSFYFSCHWYGIFIQKNSSSFLSFTFTDSRSDGSAFNSVSAENSSHRNEKRERKKKKTTTTNKKNCSTNLVRCY